MQKEKTTRMSFRYSAQVGTTLSRLEKKFGYKTFSDVLNRIATEYEETQTQLHLKANQLNYTEKKYSALKGVHTQVAHLLSSIQKDFDKRTTEAIDNRSKVKAITQRLTSQLKKLSK